MTQPLSQHPSVDMSLLHISDTHLLGGSALLHGVIDTKPWLEQLLGRAEQTAGAIRAIVLTGDLADRGQPEAYRALREILSPHAERLGAEVIYVMGNHDEREPFSSELWGEQTSGQPLDRVYDLDGLRLIALDTSVPGFHHGELEQSQLEWLSEVLATPAAKGTLLALHHPPIPTPIEMMGVIELDDQASLWRVLEGSDVRGILAGHLHYSSYSVRQQVPISVAAAMCYNIDLLAPEGVVLSGINSGQASALVSVYPDQVVFSEIPVGDLNEVFTQGDADSDQVRQWTTQQRRAVFSDKNSAFNQQESAQQSGQ